MTTRALAANETHTAPPGAALASVGRLHIPGQRYNNGYARHYDESCSATLITDRELAKSSNLIISAWHCIELYRDLSKPLTFETADGAIRSASLLHSGGGMHSDWALLRLNSPLPSPAFLGTENHQGAKNLLMAGYPRSLSSSPRVLAIATDCQIIGDDGPDRRSDCVLQKGASGGAVFSVAHPGPQYLGVISRGDGESQSIYVPLRRFRDAIRAFLENASLP
ncbi:MAG: serine protease [Congregibacter sp.]|nr:serine protease [Congregibacter sp.]